MFNVYLGWACAALSVGLFLCGYLPGDDRRTDPLVAWITGGILGAIPLIVGALIWMVEGIV